MLTRCPEGHLFSSRRYGNICPYCSKAVILGNENKNEVNEEYNHIAYLGDLEVMSPVTGWIVCIEGPSKGMDYKVLMEKNFIGRADGMDIQILGDNSIAKRNHAVIVYDPKKRETVLLPGDSQGLVYVNNETIYNPVKLNNYDVIELGKSKFIFIPLCGEHFEWQDFEKNNEVAKYESI